MRGSEEFHREREIDRERDLQRESERKLSSCAEGRCGEGVAHNGHHSPVSPPTVICSAMVGVPHHPLLPSLPTSRAKNTQAFAGLGSVQISFERAFNLPPHTHKEPYLIYEVVDQIYYGGKYCK